MKETKDLENINGGFIPKGLLVAVGGNEDKEHDLFVLRKIVSLIKKDSVLIEVITTASEIPEEVGEMDQRAFDKIDNTTVQFMHIKTRAQAQEEQYVLARGLTLRPSLCLWRSYLEQVLFLCLGLVFRYHEAYRTVGCAASDSNQMASFDFYLALYED